MEGTAQARDVVVSRGVLGRGILPLGCVSSTPAAAAALEEAGESPLKYLLRHKRGDWGEVGRRAA